MDDLPVNRPRPWYSSVSPKSKLIPAWMEPANAVNSSTTPMSSGSTYTMKHRSLPDDKLHIAGHTCFLGRQETMVRIQPARHTHRPKIRKHKHQIPSPIIPFYNISQMAFTACSRRAYPQRKGPWSVPIERRTDFLGFGASCGVGRRGAGIRIHRRGVLSRWRTC